MKRFGEDTRRILDHIARYQITTPTVIRRLFFPDPSRLDAWKSPMRTLRKGHVQSAPLYPVDSKSGSFDGKPRRRGPEESIYYHLTPAAQAALGLPEKFGRPVPAEKRLQVYAVLLFCTSGDRPRPLFTLEEFRHAFPTMPLTSSGDEARFYNRAYYLDDEGDRRLGRILVDQGGKAETIRAKCQKAFEDAEVELPEFVAERRFAIAVVTSSPEKKRSLEREFRRVPIGAPTEPVPIRVQAFADLLPLAVAKETHAA